MKKCHPLDLTVRLQNPHYANHHPTNTFVLGHIVLAIPVKHVCLPAKCTLTPCKSASRGACLSVAQKTRPCSHISSVKGAASCRWTGGQARFPLTPGQPATGFFPLNTAPKALRGASPWVPRATPSPESPLTSSIFYATQKVGH